VSASPAAVRQLKLSAILLNQLVRELEGGETLTVDRVDRLIRVSRTVDRCTMLLEFQRRVQWDKRLF
jgi:hypothetical protein